MQLTIATESTDIPRTPPWIRAAMVSAVKDRIWTYLTPSSQREDVELAAAAMLGWPTEDIATLGQVQFLLSAEVGALLDSLPYLARSLTISSDRLEEISRGRLRGPVLWQRTFSTRASAGDRQLFVTAPSSRVYQTPENELLKYVLDAVVSTGRQLGWSSHSSAAQVSTMVRDRIVEAERWQQNRMIISIESVVPTPRSLARVRSGRHALRYEPVVKAYEKLVALVEHLDRGSIRAAIEQTAIVAVEDGTLFELLTMFSTIDALNHLGWNLKGVRLIQGAFHANGQRDDGRRIELWYQSVPKWLSRKTRYVQIGKSHGLTDGRTLRPDLTIRWVDRAGHERVLLVECKLVQGVGGVMNGARAALYDLLAYRRNFHEALTDTGEPYGLGVAWGVALRPDMKSEVVLCTLDTLRQTLRLTDG